MRLVYLDNFLQLLVWDNLSDVLPGQGHCLKIETCDKENWKIVNLSDVNPGACPGRRSGKTRGLSQSRLLLSLGDLDYFF